MWAFLLGIVVLKITCRENKNSFTSYSSAQEQSVRVVQWDFLSIWGRMIQTS